ncbi:MAG TPA: hypothetical protein VGQ52_10195 [Gemmatimonadaceae bacterium]|nr:hypothetical protein [Gemmatimonadaceae bacterium]
MADRRPIQQAHERAYVDHFLDWFNRAYRTDSTPNPAVHAAACATAPGAGDC